MSVAVTSPGSSPTLAAPLRTGEADRPLAGLAGSPLSGRFRHWSGTSGARHLFSAFPLPSQAPLDDVPRYADAVLLAVHRREDGSRSVLMVGDTGPVPDLVFDGRDLRDALRRGANEVHMHLLAEDAAARRAIVRDFGG